MFHVELSAPAHWLAAQLRELDFGFNRLGVDSTPQQREQFSRYLSLLWREGQKFNLFSQKDLDRLTPRHILESVGWVFRLKRNLIGKAVDVGSGAGFPGIPLQILFPQLELVLVESIAKKARFLQLVLDELDLKKATVVRERVEVLAQDESFRHQFDLGFARAVAPLPKLLGWSAPLFKKGAHFFAIKGGDLHRELKAVEPLVKSGKINLNLYDYFINFISNREGFAERKIIEIEFRKE